MFPGAGYVAAIIAAAESKSKIALEAVSFKKMLVLDESAPTKTQVMVNPSSSASTSVTISFNF